MHIDLTNLILGLATIILPWVVARIKENQRIPDYVKPWVNQITDADIIEAINEAAKLSNMSKEARLVWATKYLQDRIDALPTAAANWLIQDRYTRNK